MARIFIEIEVKGIHQRFEFETDDEINCKDFKEHLIKDIGNENSNYKLSSNSGIYNPRLQCQLREVNSLRENGVISGDCLYIL